MPDITVDLTVSVTDGEQPPLTLLWRSTLPVVQPGTGVIPIGGAQQQRPVSVYFTTLEVSLVQADGPVRWASFGLDLLTLATGGLIALAGAQQLFPAYTLANTTGAPHTARHFDAGA